MSHMALEKPAKYFRDVRWDIINSVAYGENRVLEIGCGVGNTGLELKKSRKASVVWGIEINSQIAEEASLKLDKVISADIETLELSEKFEEAYFDYIIAADVLEHLFNPWNLIKELKKYLKKDGFIVASLPNVRYWEVFKFLLVNKSWKYSSDGVLDWTHLRFFTKTDIINMFVDNGFEVKFIRPKFRFNKKNVHNIFNYLTLFLMQDFLTRQYVIKVKKV